MLRQARNLELHDLCDKLGSALGVTAKDIMDSERFEQAIYDMAKAEARLHDLNVSNSARFGIDYKKDRIQITYDLPVSTTKLADFYHKYFPETEPEYVYGLINSISFLKSPFISKVLPTMKIWRTRPSCLTDNNIHYVDSSTMSLQSPIKPEFGSAVFITGADPKLGAWETAFRLNYNETTKGWEYQLPAGLNENEFKFLTGAFELGEKVSSQQLTYENGVNRTLIMHDHFDVDRELPLKPTGHGGRC